MLDPQLIRDHVEIVRRRLESRGVDLSATIEDLGKLDFRAAEYFAWTGASTTRSKRIGFPVIAKAKSQGLSIDAFLQSGEQYGVKIKDWEEQLEKVETDRQALCLTLPNLPHESVPIGRSAQDNPEVRRYGETSQL